MVQSHGFRCQGTTQDGDKTILDNSDKVGENCLTYMETIENVTTRCKIYNKMVQMLECKGVRDSVGCHWKDWVSQDDTRLARARDEAEQRGLTRAEVTFYCDNAVPTDAMMQETLTRIVGYVDRVLVYSTPYACVWKSYCDIMLHSLVVVDRTHDTAIIVYTYNELTHNISGQCVSNWRERERWCLANLTLNGNMPIDIIDVCEVSRIGKGDTLLHITGGRYFKTLSDGYDQFTTRLVGHNGVFSFRKGTEESNAILVQKAGLESIVTARRIWRT